MISLIIKMINDAFFTVPCALFHSFNNEIICSYKSIPEVIISYIGTLILLERHHLNVWERMFI